MNIIAWGPQVMGVKLFLKRVWAMIAHVEGSIEMLYLPLGCCNPEKLRPRVAGDIRVKSTVDRVDGRRCDCRCDYSVALSLSFRRISILYLAMRRIGLVNGIWNIHIF